MSISSTPHNPNSLSKMKCLMSISVGDKAGNVLISDFTELNFLACKSSDSNYYDVYLQTGSDTPSGKTCSNYQTLHLPCLC